jgi:hypothetical protein
MFPRSATVRKCCLLAAALLLCLPAVANAALFTLGSTIVINAGNNAGTGVLGTLNPVYNSSGAVNTAICAGFTNCGTVLLSGTSIDLVGQDVFVFDMTLTAGSTAVDLIRVGMGLGFPDLINNPKGAGIWTGDAGQAPDDINASLVLLAADFEFDNGGVSAANLDTGDPKTVRLFVTYQKTAGGAGAISNGMTATFMISPAGSATSFSVSGTIIPEPGTILLLGAGLVGMAIRGRKRAK